MRLSFVMIPEGESLNYRQQLAVLYASKPELACTLDLVAREVLGQPFGDTIVESDFQEAN
jgi:hypothetical protein